MNNFGTYYTPEHYYKEIQKDFNLTQLSLKKLKQMANAKGKCEVCEMEDVWKLGQCDMCFTCTTGESDASDDVELI